MALGQRDGISRYSHKYGVQAGRLLFTGLPRQSERFYQRFVYQSHLS